MKTNSAGILNRDLVLYNQFMLNSFYYLTKTELIERNGSLEEQAEELFNAPFVVVSHGIESDPIFKYGNAMALELFEMDWNDFTKMPSRLSTEPVQQELRAEFMLRVTRDGFVDNYQGIRISKNGKRFLIKDAIVWNVLDALGVRCCGQAAVFKDWEFLGYQTDLKQEL